MSLVSNPIEIASTEPTPQTFSFYFHQLYHYYKKHKIQSKIAKEFLYPIVEFGSGNTRDDIINTLSCLDKSDWNDPYKLIQLYHDANSPSESFQR